jgi:hypothetical protein
MYGWARKKRVYVHVLCAHAHEKIKKEKEENLCS